MKRFLVYILHEYQHVTCFNPLLLVHSAHYEGAEKIFPNAIQFLKWKIKMAESITTEAMKMAKAKEKLPSSWQKITFHELQKKHMR